MALNNRMKEVQKAALSDEKHTIQLLQRIYEQAAKDTEAKIAALNARTDLQNIQSIVYQKQYQEALKKQLDGIINDLHTQSFTTVSEYLGKSYEHGFYGTLYDLHGQGVPFLFPIRQDEVVKALNNDYSNIAKTQRGKDIYKRMGENTDYLKKAVRAEVSRGIANGSSWLDMASHVAKGMNSPFNRAMKRAFLITRTEGHRIQNQATVDVQKRAKGLGADIVKQWDATLDANTRPWHAEADGQIREIDEEFDVGGEKMKAPGIGGSARNVCNCRCVLLQRAKWALGEAELKILQDRASFFGLDKTKDFEDFKQKYLKLPKNADTMNLNDVLSVPVKSSDTYYDALLTKLNEMKVTYNPVRNHTKQLSDEEIIKILAGGDNTSGSCASVGLAYVGQKQGWDVRDFRGGESEEFFSNGLNLSVLSKAKGMKALKADGKCSLTVGNRLLKQAETGKEYYLCVGRHASIVRKTEGGTLQYLELQSPTRSGWTDFNGNPKSTLHDRFGCTSTSDYGTSSTYDFMLDLEDSDFSTDDFKSLLGYINTSDSEQKKGKHGTIK